MQRTRAEYQKSLRRLNRFERGRSQSGFGRPPLLDYKYTEPIDEIIVKNFRLGNCIDYQQLTDTMEHIYEEKIDKMSPETREKYPSNLRPNYVYEATKRLEICTKKPVLAEKERDECSTA